MYNNFNISSNFKLTRTAVNEILQIMNNIEASKAAGVDKFSGIFIKGSVKVLAKAISLLCNLSIFSGVFPGAFKLAKLNQLFKKGSKI